MNKEVVEKVFNTYDNFEPIWDVEDKWHMKTRKEIELFLFKNMNLINSSKRILNAGSGGESYSLDDKITTHLDVVKNRIISKPNHIVSSIEDIQCSDNTFDFIVCVGSVLNYADPVASIKEFARVSKISAHLFIEFETSNTLELIFKAEINKNSTLVRTFYKNNEELIWYYSENWIKKILLANNFNILEVRKWHYFSPLIYRLTKNNNFSSIFYKLDPIFRNIPIFNKYSSNIMIHCIKLE